MQLVPFPRTPRPQERASPLWALMLFLAALALGASRAGWIKIAVGALTLALLLVAVATVRPRRQAGALAEVIPLPIGRRRKRA